MLCVHAPAITTFTAVLRNTALPVVSVDAFVRLLTSITNLHSHVCGWTKSDLHFACTDISLQLWNKASRRRHLRTQPAEYVHGMLHLQSSWNVYGSLWTWPRFIGCVHWLNLLTTLQNNEVLIIRAPLDLLNYGVWGCSRSCSKWPGITRKIACINLTKGRCPRIKVTGAQVLLES